MNSHSATDVVLLTPAGRGAVASVLVEGAAATEMVERLFHARNGRPLAAQPLDKIVFGRWQNAVSGEELVVCRRDQRRVEIHCHGGHAASAAIIASLVELGCREISWQDWTVRSTSGPLAAAARVALATAATERTAAILHDQLTGALERALDLVAGKIALGNLSAALRGIDALLAWDRFGSHLTTPWKVVLAGRPNVGKSSLINALVGYERAIVHDVAGTTRDIVTAITALDGWPVELADTAGLRASSEPTEAAGVRLAEDHLATADLVVLVYDARRSESAADEALARQWPGALVVWNKCDLLPRSMPSRCSSALYTSATASIGIENLARTIAARLVPRVPASGEAVPFTAAHVESLRQVRAALAAETPQVAAELLASLRGRGGAKSTC